MWRHVFSEEREVAKLFTNPALSKQHLPSNSSAHTVTTNTEQILQVLDVTVKQEKKEQCKCMFILLLS